MWKRCTPLWRKVHVQAQSTWATGHFWKWQKCTPLWCEPHVQVKIVRALHVQTAFRVQASFYAEGAMDPAAGENWAKCVALLAISKTITSVGHLKRICKDASCAASVVRERHPEVREQISWERLPFGASDLQVSWDAFAWQVHDFVWPCLTFSWQEHYFGEMGWKNRKTHRYDAVSSALNFPFLKEAELLRFDVVKVVSFENWGSLAGLFLLWCFQVLKELEKSRRNEKLRLSAFNLQISRKSRRIASFTSLQVDR